MSDIVSDDRRQRRRQGFILIGAVFLIAAIIWGLYWLVVGRFRESTDDAYVAGNIVAVTARENATVTALHADNTQAVTRGQLLIEMDPAMAEVAMTAAQANLARSVRSVRGSFASADSYQAQLAQAQVALTQAQSDYARRKQALGGAVSGEELSHARDAVSAAQGAVTAARGGLAQANAGIAGMDIAHNPDVLAAQAQLRAAAIALAHMKIVAPVDGVVAQRTVQVGQRVNAGASLMAVVPLANVWVDANFKESQLSGMRLGQPVTITTDFYGGKVTYHGRVAGLGAGSGAAFALLPAQNASGNWIKIVQRVPVRIALESAELRDHPLRVGLSVGATVDISDPSGPLLAAGASGAVTSGDTGEPSKAEIDALIARIIAENRQ